MVSFCFFVFCELTENKGKLIFENDLFHNGTALSPEDFRRWRAYHFKFFGTLMTRKVRVARIPRQLFCHLCQAKTLAG